MTPYALKISCKSACFILLFTLAACGDSQKREDNTGTPEPPVNSTIDSPDNPDSESEELDLESSKRLQDSLMSRMKQVTEAQNEQVDETFSNDFDNSSEQHRQSFIDQTLEQTERVIDAEAEKLAEKLESTKEIEHSPLDHSEQ